MPAESSRGAVLWRYARALAAPVLLWIVFVAALVDTFQSRLQGDEEYDRAALREWIDEARVFRATLPELVRGYLAADVEGHGAEGLAPLRQEIEVQLRSLADPTKMYGGQLPLFPAIYRLELSFPEAPELTPIVWESGIPRPRLNQ